MVRSFTLSFAAVDLLLESLRLGSSPFPFEIPAHGHTLDERAGIRRAVFGELERRNLARGDNLEPDVENALTRFVQPERAITLFGTLGRGKRLFARLGSIGSHGVLAVRDGRSLRFDYIRHTSLIAAAVGLLPDHRPGAGQSVTVDLAAPAEPENGGRIAGVARPPRTGRVAQLRAAETMLAEPKLRFGQFRVLVRGPDRAAPELFWFDTANGRYMTVGGNRPDGARWSTYSPADNQRIGHQLTSQLAALTG